MLSIGNCDVDAVPLTELYNASVVSVSAIKKKPPLYPATGIILNSTPLALTYNPLRQLLCEDSDGIAIYPLSPTLSILLVHVRVNA